MIELIRQTDVLVEGYRPGVMARYKLGYPQLREINSNLIYCSITGYGQKGPYAQLPSHDPNIQALSGIMALTQGPDGPGLSGIPITDILAGSNAAMAILMALISRQKEGGGGQHLDISMLDAAVWAVGISRGDVYLATGQYLRAGRRPLHIYKTLDGKYICLVVLEEKFWQTVCDRLGLEEYVKELATIHPFSEDTPRRREIIGRLTDIFRTRTRQAWFELLSDCCLTPVLNLEEVFENENTKAHDLLVWFDDPELGQVPCLGLPFQMSRTPGQIRNLPPLKGEHTDQILSQLGKKDSQG